MGPGDLKDALSWLPEEEASELIVGFESSDDAAVFRLEDGTALLQTVDFFPPVVDSPRLFGQIAAANALSDIYAMGGRPITALNLAAFPCGLELDLLGEILLGGHEKVREAGALIVGGHTIQDNEPKYGLAVTGLVEIKDVVTNAGLKPGDALVLTKPLGIGILTTALKGEVVTEEEIMDAILSAAELNRAASEAMLEIGVDAATDITGFGLLGHLREMALSSGVAARIEAEKIPVHEGAIYFAKEGIIPGGARNNRAFLDDHVDFLAEGLPPEILYDPQTSGGLVIGVEADKVDRLVDALKSKGVATRAVIGRAVEGEPGRIEVV